MQHRRRTLCQHAVFVSLAVFVCVHLAGCGPEVFIALTFAEGGFDFDNDFWIRVTGDEPDERVRLRVSIQPATTAGPNLPFTTQPRIEVINSDGSVNTSDNTTQVTVSIVPGTGVAGSTLSGGLTVRAVNGRVSFANLSIDRPGNAFQLAFTAPSLLSATSAFFNVGTGQSTLTMAILSQPGGATSGNLFASQPTLELRDATGARNTQDSFTQVTASITTGTGSAGVQLGGLRTVTAQGGLVRFSTLQIDLAGAGYSLTFSANPTLALVVSGSFSVSALGSGNAPFVPLAPGGAATYFVAPTGFDGNPGTLAQPFRTIQPAANLAVPGDIIEIADGSYPRFTVSKIATAPSPIVFRASASVTIDTGTSTGAPEGIAIAGSQHVVLYGLRVINAFSQGVGIADSQFITLQGCTLANCGDNGLLITRSSDCLIEGNHVFGAVAGSGIFVTGASDRVTLRGNFSHDNASQGIDLVGGASGDNVCSQCVIERNLCASNLNVGIRFGSVRDSDLRNNLVRHNGGFGIELSDAAQGTGFGSLNNRLLHNTVLFNSGQGQAALALLNVSTGNTISNNVLVGGAKGAFAFTANSLAGLAEDFNLLHSMDGVALAEIPGSTTYTLATWRTLTMGAANDIAGAPAFLNPANGNYALTATSMGVDGGAISGVAQTYDAANRPQGAAYDMGCHER